MSDSLTKQFYQIDEILKGAKKVLVASHENPDPDAIGSVLALHCFFKEQNKISFPYLPDSPPKYLNFLPGFFEIKNEINDFQPDILFCLDYGDFRRLKLPNLLQPKNLITLDHHVGGDQRGEIKVIESNISSTAEIIYLLMKELGININKSIATCLLTGIISDSGGLRHSSTSSRTFKIASELFSLGVNYNQILHRTLSLDTFLEISKTLGKALTRIKFDKKNRLAYSWLSFKDLQPVSKKILFSDLAGIANLISIASPVNFGLFLVEYEPRKIKGSLRSGFSGERRVNELAKAMGGGGHPYAAGFKQEGTIEEVLKKVLDLIE